MRASRLVVCGRFDNAKHPPNVGTPSYCGSGSGSASPSAFIPTTMRLARPLSAPLFQGNLAFAFASGCVSGFGGLLRLRLYLT